MGTGIRSGPARVVIVGGGFAGLHAARTLRRAPAAVTLVDRRNHHLFLPLLYQVATAGLNPGDIARPIRRILRRQPNVAVILGELARVDSAARQVILSDGAALAYDFLILACGAGTSWFGHDAWSGRAPGLHDLDDALEIRSRIILAWEGAEREPDARRRRRLLTFVVVGGGPTGVETAGAIAEMSRLAMAREFRAIDPATSRILLLEGGERVLPTFPPQLSARARASLQRLGVEVRTGARVTGMDDGGIQIGAERIEAATVIWAAGVAASLRGIEDAPRTRSGQLIVEADLSIPGHPEIFVAGDLAAARQEGGFVPGLAPAAIQMGRHAAGNVARDLAGAARLPFRYRHRGALATIGRAAAVADFGRVRISGWFAWVTWLTVHIFFLIGFRNRAIVLFQWGWAYWTYERGARLVTGARAGGRGAS
jgi:NADH dehydrogenase